jgi:hypothetical protein
VPDHASNPLKTKAMNSKVLRQPSYISMLLIICKDKGKTAKIALAKKKKKKKHKTLTGLQDYQRSF